MIDDHWWEEFRSTAALTELGVFSQARLADSKKGPIKFHVKNGVRRLLKLDDLAGPLEGAQPFLGVRGFERRRGQQHTESMSCRAKRQHNAFELKPVAECGSVRRQFRQQRDERKLRPTRAVRGIEGRDRRIAASEKILPPPESFSASEARLVRERAPVIPDLRANGCGGGKGDGGKAGPVGAVLQVERSDVAVPSFEPSSATRKTCSWVVRDWTMLEARMASSRLLYVMTAMPSLLEATFGHFLPCRAPRLRNDRTLVPAGQDR